MAFYGFMAVLSAYYVFVGIAVAGYAIASGNWLLIVAPLAAYVLNLVLLRHANKHDWIER